MASSVKPMRTLKEWKHDAINQSQLAISRDIIIQEVVDVLDKEGGIDAPHSLNGKLLTPSERVAILIRNLKKGR